MKTASREKRGHATTAAGRKLFLPAVIEAKRVEKSELKNIDKAYNAVH